MSVTAQYAAANVDLTVIRFYGSLDLIRSHATGLSSGASDIARVIAALRTIDVGYNQAAQQWAALSAVATAGENTRVGAIKTALDDLLIAFADALNGLTVPAVVDIGAGYGGTRTQKLAALNRSFPYVTFTLPAGLTGKATALVAAIDAFTAG